jgi:hypothetical protein
MTEEPMVRSRLSKQASRLVWTGCLVLAGCGQTERGKAETAAQAGSGGSAGAPDVAGPAGAAGSAGAAPVEPPPVDVAGRWALFVFDDPVGVQLSQHGEVLTGMGCAAGAPPLQDLIVRDYCGAITGEVHGSAARFWFPVELGGMYPYTAETLVSMDRQRMTGHFKGVGDVQWPTAWLRVAHGEPWLPWESPLEENPLLGIYDLTLESADADEYSPAQTYRLYFRREGIASDLGSFWHAEMQVGEPGQPIVVGPVSMTAPELATALRLETDAESQSITRVEALTGSGHNYVFNVARGSYQ